MNNEYAWWLLIVGLAVGAAVTWFLIGGPARDEADVDDESAAEAAWISATIEGAGGVAPADLVEQVLELHRAYLRRTPPDSIVDPGSGNAAAV